jgi:hypothetical protein
MQSYIFMSQYQEVALKRVGKKLCFSLLNMVFHEKLIQCQVRDPIPGCGVISVPKSCDSSNHYNSVFILYIK